MSNKLNSHDLGNPYIISEVGVNHEGDMDNAKQMIMEIAEAGGDAVKFQAYKAENLASKYSPAYWDTNKEKTKSQYELFRKNDKFWKHEFEELADFSASYKIDFLATPFDIESVDFLDELVPIFKIASADITNKPFLQYIASKDKPIILSTGASTVSEIWRALEWIDNVGDNEVILLHCILNYPTLYKDANLGMIKKMKKIFPENLIGYSDHTLPDNMIDVLLTAWHLGAVVIEKHYTFDKNLPGNDHYHAMDYDDLKNFKDRLKFNKQIIGPKTNYLKIQEGSRKYARRSLVAKQFIAEGNIIKKGDLTWKRPGTGIPPWMIEQVVGGMALEDINEDEIIEFHKIKFESI